VLVYFITQKFVCQVLLWKFFEVFVDYFSDGWNLRRKSAVLNMHKRILSHLCKVEKLLFIYSFMLDLIDFLCYY